MMILYTDYPFTELGDTPHKRAPIREVKPLSYDGDKYVKVLVEGVQSELKCGYLYTQRGRCGDVPYFDPARYFNL
jgi:hypothetical protein